MVTTHDFQTPRNLFEKLLRDSERLNLEINGDNVFNFAATAIFLKDWIKKSPVSETQVARRLVREINGDEEIKFCADLVKHNIPYSIVFDHKENKTYINSDPSQTDVIHFKNHIVEIFCSYFKVKG